MTPDAFAALQARLSMLALRLQGGELSPDLSNVAAQIHRAESEDLPGMQLKQRLGLSDLGMRVVWTLATMATESEYRAAVASRFGTDLVTADVLGKLALDGARLMGLRELAPTGALRRLAVIERADSGGDLVHEVRRGWALSRRVLGWLYGDATLDPELSRLCRASAADLAIEQLAVEPAVVVAGQQALSAPDALVVATGTAGMGRRTLLSALVRARGERVLELDARRLASDHRIFDAQLAAFRREVLLLEMPPLIRNADVLDRERLELLAQHVDTWSGLVLATSTDRRLDWKVERTATYLELSLPGHGTRAQHWKRALGRLSDPDADLLASRYPVSPALTVRASALALARAGDNEISETDLAVGLRAAVDGRIAGLANRIEVSQTWNDLVIQDEQFLLVCDLISRVRQRHTVLDQWGFGAKLGKGFATAALFSGPPGTGKTMLASLISRELGLEIYAADTSKLVSKYIGETEKHLAELFDAAEAGHAVLLFDEADSLFGKRTDVRSSNDRYANLETNFLLQRLESFRGICIRTSNHESSIDTAFARRLSLHLRLDLPGPAERDRLWRAMLPPDAPVEPTIDFARLAQRFEMSGGYIRNAALRAAFQAADEGVEISHALLHRAALVEYEGMGKLAA